MYDIFSTDVSSLHSPQLLVETTQLRTDDHSTIGSILFAVLTPALMWRRAHIINRELRLFPRSTWPVVIRMHGSHSWRCRDWFRGGCSRPSCA